MLVTMVKNKASKNYRKKSAKVKHILRTKAKEKVMTNKKKEQANLDELIPKQSKIASKNLQTMHHCQQMTMVTPTP